MVAVVEQDKVRALTCMCIEKGEKQYKITDQNGHPLFTAVEDKDLCCQRCGCLCSRDFNLHVKKESEDAESFYNYYVPRTYCKKFGCMSCCRIGIEVKEKGGTPIGSVGSDFQCCSCWPKFSVRDPQSSVRYTVQQDTHFCANILCCGAHSRHCCGIDCYIPASLSVNPQGSGKSTTLTHQAGSRGADADAYQLVFPEGASVNDKLLLVAATICVDYKMYTAPSQEHMKESGHAAASHGGE